MPSSWLRWWRRPVLHVVIDLSLLLPGGMNGGIRPAVFALVTALRRREGRRLRVTFLTNAWTHADVAVLRRPGDRAVCVMPHGDQGPDPSIMSPGDIVCIPPPADLIKSLAPHAYYFPLCEELRPTGSVPVVLLHPDLLHRDFPATLSAEQIARRERFFADNVRRATAIQTVSEFSKQRLRHHYDVPAERIFVTYLSAHDRLATAEADHEQTVWQQSPYFLYPANFWAHKNHRNLLEAFGRYRLASGAGAWRLALTGFADDEARRVLKLASDSGLSNAVRFWGHLPNQRFAALLRGASGLVFPSRYEGFGMPLVEAMDAGVPVLASRDGSIPEVCGDAAEYFDASDVEAMAKAMQAFATDTARRTELRRRGRSRSRRFSIVRDARALSAVLRAAAGFDLSQ